MASIGTLALSAAPVPTAGDVTNVAAAPVDAGFTEELSAALQGLRFDADMAGQPGDPTLDEVDDAADAALQILPPATLIAVAGAASLAAAQPLAADAGVTAAADAGVAAVGAVNVATGANAAIAQPMGEVSVATAQPLAAEAAAMALATDAAAAGLKTVAQEAAKASNDQLGAEATKLPNAAGVVGGPGSSSESGSVQALSPTSSASAADLAAVAGSALPVARGDGAGIGANTALDPDASVRVATDSDAKLAIKTAADATASAAPSGFELQASPPSVVDASATVADAMPAGPVATQGPATRALGGAAQILDAAGTRAAAPGASAPTSSAATTVGGDAEQLAALAKAAADGLSARTSSSMTAGAEAPSVAVPQAAPTVAFDAASSAATGADSATAVEANPAVAVGARPSGELANTVAAAAVDTAGAANEPRPTGVNFAAQAADPAVNWVENSWSLADAVVQGDDAAPAPRTGGLSAAPSSTDAALPAGVDPKTAGAFAAASPITDVPTRVASPLAKDPASPVSALGVMPANVAVQPAFGVVIGPAAGSVDAAVVTSAQSTQAGSDPVAGPAAGTAAAPVRLAVEPEQDDAPDPVSAQASGASTPVAGGAGGVLQDGSTIADLAPKQLATLSSRLEPHNARLDSGPLQVEILRLVRRGGGEVVMELTPPDQGKFRVELRIDGSGTAMLRVDGVSDSTMTRLQQGAPELKSQFEQMGLNLQLDLSQQRDYSQARNDPSPTPWVPDPTVGSGATAPGTESLAPRRRADLAAGQVHLYA